MNYAPSCGIELQVNQNGTVSVSSDTSVGPYDGGDDTLVGIVNNSTAPVTAVTVTGPGSDLSGFDGDGLCAYVGCSNGPTGYEGPGTSFVTKPNQPDSAEVDFTPALAPGARAYFSLEGALQYAQLTAREGPLQDAKHALIYVHGINEKASSDVVDFATIFNRVQNVDYRGFVYYEDQAQAVAPDRYGACGTGLPTDVVAKAAAVGMPIVSSDATGTPTCDGSSDIGINAIKLDEQIKAEYAASGNQQVILVGYSMGGSIIRGMLVYSQLVGDGVANTMIDSVSFIHGVQQGSYLASLAQAAGCSSSVCGLPGLPSVYNPILNEISNLAGLPLDRPAGQELQDASVWFAWVNSHSANLPGIPYFNTYADIRVVAQVCLIPGVFACQDVGSPVTWGDDVVLRGTDSPTDLSLQGGHEFLNGARGPQNWEFQQLHRYYWDPLNPVSELTAYYQAFLGAPEQHINILTEMGQTHVTDCSNNSTVSADDEMVLLLNGRASGHQYSCGPIGPS